MEYHARHEELQNSETSYMVFGSKIWRLCLKLVLGKTFSDLLSDKKKHNYDVIYVVFTTWEGN